MKIALVFPKSTFLETPLVFPPLGLFYIAARLESLGHTTEFFDLNVDDFPEDAYDEIWVSATSPQMAEIKRIGKIVKDYDAKSVLGGAGAWANPSSCMDLDYDLVVGGEADEPENIKKILATEKGYLLCPVSKTLDWVLPPVRRWSWKYNSQLTGFDGIKVPATTAFNTRGCPLMCAFCESGRHGVIWSELTRYEPLNVVEFQLAQMTMMGYKGVFFYDDVKPLNKKRMLEELELYKQYEIMWRCFLRSDIVNKQGGREYLEQMRDAGLVEIFVGVESASNEIKDNIHKKTTIEQDTNIVRWCKDLGIRCKTSFILGLPGESHTTMEETRRWILEHRPERVQVGRLIPFKGTPLGDHPENFDLNYDEQPPDEWFYSGDYGMGTKSFVSTSHLTRDEIDVFWHSLMDELKREGIPS